MSPLVDSKWDMPAEKCMGFNGETKKVSKPLMEKRRRARINRSLTELKNLLFSGNNGTSAAKNHRNSKLEKADILEMTVVRMRKYLHHSSPQSSSVSKFDVGFSECMREISRFLERYEDLNPVFGSRILQHLSLFTTSQIPPCRSSYDEDSSSRESSSSPTPSRMYPARDINFSSNSDSSRIVSDSEQSAQLEAVSPNRTENSVAHVEDQIDAPHLANPCSQDDVWRPW